MTPTTTTQIAPGWETTLHPDSRAPRHRSDPVTDKITMDETVVHRTPYARLLPEPVPASLEQINEMLGSSKRAPVWLRPWLGWFL